MEKIEGSSRASKNAIEASSTYHRKRYFLNKNVSFSENFAYALNG